MTIRRCKKCFNRLRHTREVRQGLRTYVCAVCGGRWEWVDDPAMDGAVQQLHKNKGKSGFSYVSMMNDPCCDSFGGAAVNNGTDEYYKGVGPICPEFNRPVMAYSKGKDERLIARWHWGRGKWVKVQG